MDDRSMGAADVPRSPHPRDQIAVFPAPVASASSGMGLGPIATLATQGVNGLPWAVDVTYRSSDGRLLSEVKTVRSPHGLDPRGLPVENTEIQLLNFLARTREREPGSAVPTRESFAADHDMVRTAVGEAVAVPVNIMIDQNPLSGTRIDALGVAVIEVNWGECTVYLTGTPDHLGTLELHTTTTADVDHL
ncbi:hypothetical protein ACIA8G_34870 [Lentzea sp. NPDC051213]|uniref:hypothetical protein n=1 Tax=Lentzea sp. NPDC051213 TaxID=3364126 RepID=UPI00378956D8